MTFYRSYFDSRLFRTLLDRTHIAQQVLMGGAEYSPLFRLPPEQARVELQVALGDPATPRVRSPHPVLIDWWRQGEIDQVHLFNYADSPQDVVVSLPWPAHIQVVSPDRDDTLTVDGQSLDVHLDVYTVLLCTKAS